ncbi:MAG TPA: 50S ribosomal protein L18 [Bacteriovoracaceae bacterium]|nr:50S ribosomal protein L18 [Bacteriovoracaceae bacterium]
MRKNTAKIKNETKSKEYRRRLSIRKKVIGSAESPRLSVTKTNKHLRVQAIDDVKSITLFSVQTYGKTKATDQANAEGAKKVGAAVAATLKQKNLNRAVFDRSGKQYTGVIKALADSIRENGIQI